MRQGHIVRRHVCLCVSDVERIVLSAFRAPASTDGQHQAAMLQQQGHAQAAFHSNISQVILNFTSLSCSDRPESSRKAVAVPTVEIPAGLEKKRRDYTFRRYFNERPGNIPGCSKAGIQYRTVLFLASLLFAM